MKPKIPIFIALIGIIIVIFLLVLLVWSATNGRVMLAAGSLILLFALYFLTKWKLK